MSRFNVDTQLINENSSTMHDLAQALRKHGEILETIKNSLAIDTSVKKQLLNSLAAVTSQIINEAAKMNSFSDALLQIANGYAKADAEIAGIEFGGYENRDAAGKSEKNFFQKILEKLRFWLVQIGIIKAEKQERVEGEPVDALQEKEMDLYLQREIEKIKRKDRYSEENWRNASLEERRAILNEYLHEVARTMGLPEADYEPFNEESENGYCTMGYYSDSLESISINEWVLQHGDDNGFPSYSLFSTLVHEMRHYYQDQAVKHPEQYVVTEETIQLWQDSFDNYKSMEDFMDEGMSEQEAYQAYRNQAVEADARSFAGEN